MSSIEIRPMEGVGVEIHGVDLAEELPREDFQKIQDAFAEHGLVFFRDQKIDESQHIAFAERWASIDVNRFFAAHPDYPQIAIVSKEADQKDNIGGGWHTDHSYDREPAMGSILVARELPESGGDTMFASMYAAYDSLSDDLKAEIEGLNAIHSAHHIFGEGPDTYYKATDAGGGRIGNAATADTLTDVVHPIVITHPLSGKKALYVNPAFTTGIEGMEKAQADALLTKLYAAAIDSAHVHRFKWRPGSIAFWDNRATWHWALNDYQGQRRVMHRITLEGCALN